MKAIFVNPGGIGDQILFLPTVQIFKNYFPSAEIDLITEPRSTCISNLTDLYRRVKDFDFKKKDINVFQLGELLKKHKYSYFITTGSSYKAGLVAALSNAQIKIGFRGSLLNYIFFTHTAPLNTKQYASNMFAELLTPIIPKLKDGLKNRVLVPEIKLSTNATTWAKEVLNPRIKEKYYAKKILIHPGTSTLSVQKNILKGWSHKNWAKLIEKLIENPNNVVILIGGKDDEEIIKKIQNNLMFFAKPKNFFNLSSLETSIENLAALISYSDLLVCVDSAPMHIAAGLGKKVVSFFGPTDPKKLLPNDPRFVPVHVDNLECRPCLFDTRKESCEKPVCLEVTPQRMLDEINKILGY